MMEWNKEISDHKPLIVEIETEENKWLQEKEKEYLKCKGDMRKKSMKLLEEMYKCKNTEEMIKAMEER